MGIPVSRHVLVTIFALGFALAVVGAADAKGDPSTITILTPHRIALPSLPHVPLLAPAPADESGGLTTSAAFAFLDGAGIGGVDNQAGGPAATDFVHLEDPLVCGALCLVNASAFGDEGTFVFCPPAGDPNMPWHWSSGITAPGIAGCTTTAQGAWFVNTNGFVGAQSPACSGANCYTPVAIPTTATPNGQVYANWQDYDNSCSVAPNGFYVGYGGTSPNRFIIFEWFNVKNYPCATSTTTQTFEIIIYEIDSSVEVYYGTGSQSVNATGGQENSAGNAGLQFFRTPAVPQNAAIAYFDAKAPVITAINATCGVVGNNGWCRSASVTGRITDNNDVGSAGRIGFGMRNRTRALDGAAPVNYTNNTAFSLNLTDGTHTLVANATDWGLNTGTLTGSIKIDTVLPTFDPKADVIVEATGPNGALASYNAPTAQDATSGPGTVSCSPASGSQFALGATTVTCNVSDLAGNGPVATSFLVRVVDTTPPSVDPHAPVSAEATGANGAVVTYSSPASNDLVSGSGTSTCAPASGALFPLGASTVTCTASDGAGNTGNNTFQVNVVDTTPPTVDTRADVTLEATGPNGASAVFTSPASHDIVAGDGGSSCSPASGTTFALGDTTVTCTATDGSGNSGSSIFRVHVVDTTPPTIDGHSNEIAEATSAAGAVVTYSAPASRDLVDGNGVATCAPASGSAFQLGETTVTCNAADSRGNAATPKTFKVTVVDTTAPTIAPHADVTVEASSLAGAIAFFTAPMTSDLVDGTGFATCAPPSGSLFAVGDTTVTCSATDAAGNVAAATHFRVHVSLEIVITVRMDRSFYDARDSLQNGVHGVVRVTTGDGSPLPNSDVRLRVARVVPVLGELDNSTRVETTDANGEIVFALPIQFGLPGDYVVDATSISTGFAGSATTSYSVGLNSTIAAVIDRR